MEDKPFILVSDDGETWAEKKDGWIKVEDRLPDEFTLVNVFDGTIVTSATRAPNVVSPLSDIKAPGWAFCNGMKAADEDVDSRIRPTHWQDLPEPPPTD